MGAIPARTTGHDQRRRGRRGGHVAVIPAMALWHAHTFAGRSRLLPREEVGTQRCPGDGRDVAYGELARRLTEVGIPETEGSIAVRINRRTFPTSFLFASMKVVECSSVEVEDLYGICANGGLCMILATPMVRKSDCLVVGMKKPRWLPGLFFRANGAKLVSSRCHHQCPSCCVPLPNSLSGMVPRPCTAAR